MKKGISTVLAWVFIMIAGGMIILLFGIIASAQAEAGKESLAIDALQRIDSIIATQVASRDTYAEVPIPAEEIKLTCLDIDGSILSQLEIKGFSKNLEHELVVGRDMSTSKLLLFSKRLRMPFTVGNILFISSDEEVLVIEDTTTSSAINTFVNEIPDKINLITEADGSWPEFSNLNAANFENVRVVVVSDDEDVTAFPMPLTPGKAKYIHIKPDGDWTRSGYVRYYHRDSGNFVKTGDETEYYYSGPDMLLALIWQADPEYAECFLRKLGKQLNSQIELHNKRLDLISADYLSVACPSKYSRGSLENLKVDDVLDYQTDKMYEDIADRVDQVEFDNEQILRGERCATIY